MEEEKQEVKELETTYIGTKKVKQINIVEKADLVGVLFEDDTAEDFTLEQWEALKSDKPYEDQISLRKWKPTIQRIIYVLMKDRADMGSHAWILNQVGDIIQKNYICYVSKLMGVRTPGDTLLAQVHEGLEPTDEVPALDGIDEELEKANGEFDKNNV